MLPERSCDINPFVENPSTCPNSSCFSFDLSLFTWSECVEVIFSWNVRCSAKETVILLLSWSTLYISFSKWILSVSNCFILICHYSPKVYMWNSFIFKNSGCSAKETVIVFLLWITLYATFSNSSFLFLFASIHSKCVCKSLIFLNF